MTADVLFRDVEVDGTRGDVLVLDGRVAAIGGRLDRPTGVEVLAGDGGALLPGLHDHHIHLAALAAAMRSVHVGPPEVTTHDAFARALRTPVDRPVDAWIRAIGYHESVAGTLDRGVLDRLVPDRPLRVQDRSGTRWTLNSRGLDRIGAARATHPGVLRDASGAPTGVIRRADDWLSGRLDDGFPELTEVGRRLGALGVTGVTDCTPYDDPSGPSALADAVIDGQLSQEVVVTGGVALAEMAAPTVLRLGPVKIVLDDDDLSDIDGTVDGIVLAHRCGRPVAVHVVTAAALAFALACWDVAGTVPGDRIEHGSVITPDAAAGIARRGLAVVTQPGFVAERGDRYLIDVDDADLPHLYRCRSLIALGVTVAGSTDAPYTDPDPWSAIRAARTRTTAAGTVLGPSERISAESALGLFLGDPLDLARRRSLVVGVPADLCLLHRPLGGLEPPSAGHVRATFRLGRRI